MNLNDALALIARFSNKGTQEFSGDSSSAVSSALTQGTSKTLPVELLQYLDSVCPANGLTLEGVGHPVELLKASELAWQPEMLSQLTGELAKWQDDWFLIAHDGGDWKFDDGMFKK
mgnify:CR=1 FL=1